jgi:hypothetical protein
MDARGAAQSRESNCDPQNWDGLTALFVVLAERNTKNLTPVERDWLKAIKNHAG